MYNIFLFISLKSTMHIIFLFTIFISCMFAYLYWNSIWISMIIKETFWYLCHVNILKGDIKICLIKWRKYVLKLGIVGVNQPKEVSQQHICDVLSKYFIKMCWRGFRNQIFVIPLINVSSQHTQDVSVMYICKWFSKMFGRNVSRDLQNVMPKCFSKHFTDVTKCLHIQVSKTSCKRF